MSAINPGAPSDLPGNIEAIGAGSRRRNPFVATPMWVVMLPISPGALKLWIALEGHVNEAHNGHRWCYPNQDDIAEITGMSDRSIRRHTQELAAAGLIETKVTWDPAANRKKTFYLINNEPTPGFGGNLAFADHYENKRNARSEINRPKSPDGKEGYPNRPICPVQTGQSGRFKAAKLADKLDQGNYIKGTRSKQPLFPHPADEDVMPSLFDDDPEMAAQAAPVEKIKSGSDDDEGFVAFWKVYPNKVDKADARKAWARRAKQGIDSLMLISAAGEYARWCKANPQIGVKYPSTWLNKESWTNDLPGNEFAGISKGHVPFTQDRSVFDDDEGGW